MRVFWWLGGVVTKQICCLVNVLWLCMVPLGGTCQQRTRVKHSTRHRTRRLLHERRSKFSNGGLGTASSSALSSKSPGMYFGHLHFFSLPKEVDDGDNGGRQEQLSALMGGHVSYLHQSRTKIMTQLLSPPHRSHIRASWCPPLIGHVIECTQLECIDPGAFSKFACNIGSQSPGLRACASEKNPEAWRLASCRPNTTGSNWEVTE